jgi:hypothetical protein
VTVKTYCGTAHLDYKVEFHEAITGTIPWFINRLEDEHYDVRLKTVEIIGELVNHGEL